MLKFVAVDGNDTESADEVTITTHKEEKEVIEKKTSVHLTSAELAGWEENVYVYMDAGLEKNVNRIVARKEKELKVGSIVTVGEKATAQDTDYICKVISARKERMQYVVGSDIKEDEFYVLDVVTPNVDDVYIDIDIYGEKQAQLEGVIKISAETIAENVEKNEGIVMLKSAVRNAIAQSPTVTNYTNALSEAEKAAVVAAIAGFEFQKPKVKIDITGTVLAFGIELGGEIRVKNFKVGVSVTIKNRTQVDYRYTICKSGLVTLNPLLWFYTDIQVDLANDFSISLAATVEFADAKDDIHGIIDITDEVEYVMDIAKDGQNKFAEAITGSPLWDDSELEYVDLFSIPLGQIPLPVPVVSLMMEFNVVGSLGARAGLYVEFSHHYVETTTLTNGESADGNNGKPVMYKEFRFLRNTSANEIELSVTLKGQVGFRCGLEAKLSLSVLKLNNVASVYVSFRFGPYIELSGLVNFRYSYDAVNKISETHLYGGMYLEVGLFVNAKIGAKFLVYDVNTDLFDKKIPLYGVGDRLIPLGFVEKQNSPDNPYVIVSRYGGVRMNSVQMKYLDIVTGEEIVDNALRNRYGAQLWYEFELVDAPDYQTKNHADYITMNAGTFSVSRKYPYKTLRFVVKAKMLQRHGVYASGIERIFYVEYRNPDGRDYATQYSEFINEYYVGGGSRHSEVLARLAFREGEQVSPPDFTAETLPIRQGYYLDMNDLWEKYGGKVTDTEIRLVLQSKVDIQLWSRATTYANAGRILKYIKNQTDKRKEKNPDKRSISQNDTAQAYRDYLQECEQLHLDLHDKEILFPKDLTAAHNRTMEQVKFEKNKADQKKFQKAVEKLEKFAWSEGEFFIRPAREQMELTAEGKALHHCVGGYIKRMAEGETAIFFLRKVSEPDKPFYTLELQKKRVIQCRTEHNASYDRKPDVKKFVDMWMEKVVKKGGNKKAKEAAA